MILFCRHCHVPFRESGVPIIGTPKEKRLANLLEEAGKHMQARHPDKFPLVQWMTQIGWIAIALNIKSDDKELNRQRDLACAEFVRAFGRVVTDDDIRAAVDKARISGGEPGLPADTIPVNQVTRMMVELRNLMRYEDLFPQEPPPTVEMRPAA